MKVICKECGKKFDYDVYMGLCPKCSTYYRDGMGSSEQAFYDQGTELQKRYDTHREKEERIDAIEQALRRVTQPSTNQQQSSNNRTGANPSMRQGQQGRMNPQTAQRRQPASYGAGQTGSTSRCYHGVSKEHRKEAGKKTSAVHVITAIAVIIIVLLIVLPVGLARLNEKKVQSLVQEVVVNNSVSQNKSFIYSSNDANYEISITEVKAEKGKWFGLPDGYEMIVLKYHIDTDDETIIRDENQIYSDVHMRPYLITKSGEYLTPCYTYEIAEKKGWDYDQESEEGLSNQFWYKDGVIFFGVQKKQAKGLLVNSYNFDEEEYCETTVRESFMIEKMEVKR